MLPNDFKRDVQSGKIASFYIFAGEEEFLKKEAFALLKEKVVTDPLNFECFSGKAGGAGPVFESASMMSFFGSKKLILVEDGDNLTKDSDIILSYAKNPSPFAFVVIFVKALDKRTKLFKDIEKTGAVVEFSPLYPSQLSGWIMSHTKKAGREIDNDAADALIDNTGNSLQDIVSELEKIMVYAGQRKRIVLEDVEKLSVRIKSEEIFDLINAISLKDKKKALSLLIRLMEEGKDSAEIIGLLRWQFVRLFQADEMMKEGTGSNEVASHFRIPPKYSGSFISSVNRFGKVSKSDCFGSLLDCDVSIKKGLVDDTLALEKLVISLCR